MPSPDLLPFLHAADDIRPGDVVECVEPRNHSHYLRSGMRLVVAQVERTGDGRTMLFFRAGPAIGWPCEQFRLIETRR